MRALEDGRCCPVCPLNAGCLQRLQDTTAIGFTCHACAKVSFGFYDKEMACLHCHTPFMVRKERRDLTCIVCGPAKHYSPLCYGYVDPHAYPTPFVCSHEHAEEYERMKRSKTHIVIYGASALGGGGGALTQMVRVFEGTYTVDSAPANTSFEDLIPHIRPLYLCDSCNPYVHIDASMSVRELVAQANDMREILLIARNTLPLGEQRSVDIPASPVSKIARKDNIVIRKSSQKGGVEDAQQQQEFVPVKLDGKLSKENRLAIWYAKAREMWDATEYNAQTGLFVNTPMPVAHGTTLPGMGIIQEGDSTTANEGSTPCVAVCLVRVRVKNGKKGWVDQRCSDNIYVSLKNIKQHTSVHGHTEALKRQGASDGQHYVLECDTCPRTKGTGYLKGQASWPWTHQHYSRTAQGTASQLTIENPTDDAAKPFLPVLESSTKARVVPWLQSMCGYQENVFPADSVFPEHIMRLHCMLYENTHAVVFAFPATCNIPLSFDKFVCPHKFHLSEKDDDRNTFYQLMCVPCNNVDEFVQFADKMEEELSDVNQRLETALKQIAAFDPHRDLEKEPLFQGVMTLDKPLEHTFKIPDPAATVPIIVRKTLAQNRKRPGKPLTSTELRRKYVVVQPSRDERPCIEQPPPRATVNALAPPRNKYQAITEKRRKKKSKPTVSSPPASSIKEDTPINLCDVVQTMSDAFAAAQQSGYTVNVSDYVVAVVNTLVGTCNTTFPMASKIDGFTVTRPPSTKGESTFYKSRIEPILIAENVSVFICQFTRSAIHWALSLITPSYDHLFETQPTDTQLRVFLVELFGYWTVAVNQFHHTFKVSEAYKDTRDEGKRLAGRIVQSDHPGREPKNAEREDAEEDDDEEDTFSSEDSEPTLWESLLAIPAEQQQQQQPPPLGAMIIANPEAWDPPPAEQQQIVQSPTHMAAWNKVLRVSQERLKLQQLEEEHQQLHMDKMKEREQKIREHQLHLQRARQQEQVEKVHHEAQKRKTLDKEREEMRKKARQEREAQQPSIYFNELEEYGGGGDADEDGFNIDSTLLANLREVDIVEV